MIKIDEKWSLDDDRLKKRAGDYFSIYDNNDLQNLVSALSIVGVEVPEDISHMLYAAPMDKLEEFLKSSEITIKELIDNLNDKSWQIDTSDAFIVMNTDFAFESTKENLDSTFENLGNQFVDAVLTMIKNDPEQFENMFDRLPIGLVDECFVEVK